MMTPLRIFPQNSLDHYKTMDLLDKDGFVYVEIPTGVYILKQAACISFGRLLKLLKPHGYHPLCSKPGICSHERLPTKFALCVDNSEIKCTNNDHAQNIVNACQKY